MERDLADAYDYETWRQERELERRHADEALLEDLIDRTEEA